MATIVTRAGKGSPLTHVEVDANFTNLNTGKAELASPAFTGQPSFADGTAAAPSIAHTGDLNTGLFFPAADTVAVATGGSERMRVDINGNVGIGGTVPASLPKVGLYGGIRFLANETAAATYTGIGSIVSDTVSISTSGVERMAIGGGGINVKGAGAEGGEIQLNNNGDASVGLTVDVSTANNGRVFQNQNNSTLQLGQLGGTGGIVTLHTAATERMRIDASGNVSITQTPGKYTVDVSGGATSIANGGTVDFANASGMLVVNNHNSGAVTIYLCGGGSTAVIGSVGTQVGTFAYVAGIGGYRWTNNFGSTILAGFFFVRTRATA